MSSTGNREQILRTRAEFSARITPYMTSLAERGLMEVVEFTVGLERAIPDTGVSPEGYAGIVARAAANDANAMANEHSEAWAGRTEEQRSQDWDGRVEAVAAFAFQTAAIGWGVSFGRQASEAYERQLDVLNRMVAGEEGLVR